MTNYDKKVNLQYLPKEKKKKKEKCICKKKKPFLYFLDIKHRLKNTL